MSRALCCLAVVGLACPTRSGQAAEARWQVSESTGRSGRELYEQGKYDEAARVFEAEHTLKGLYNAGMARHGAGHDALAIDRWTRYLEQAPADERPEVEQRIARARESLVTVRFTADETPVARRLVLEREGQVEDRWMVTWPGGQVTVEVGLDAAEWTVILAGGPSPPVTTKVAVQPGPAMAASLVQAPVAAPVLLRLGPPRALRRGVTVRWEGPAPAPPEQQLRAAEAHWKLLPGTWAVRAQAAGYLPAESALKLAGEPAEVVLVLRRDPIVRARLGLGIGLGVTAGMLAAVGGALLASSEKPQWPPVPFNEAGGERALSAHIRRKDAMGVLGAGLGVAIPAITAARGPMRRALAIEAGIGAGLLAAGLGWLFGEEQAAPGMSLGELNRLEGATMLLGAGAGMMTSALTSIVTYHAIQRRRGARARLRSTDMSRRGRSKP